jgi:hypothetical protein
MIHRTSPAKIRLAASAALLAMLLAACNRAPKSDETATPPPAPSGDAPAPGAPAMGAPDSGAPANGSPADSAPAPGDVPPPDQSPAAPAQPSDNAPPPTDPSPAPAPTAAIEPALGSMKTARPPAKAGVPVDLRYSFDGDPAANQPVTLHLAAVPRVAGTNLGVSIKTVQGIQVAAAGVLNVQKANANGAYRQHFSVTRQAAAPAELRVLVTMDVPEGSGFGFYSIPLDDGTTSQKQDSVKQR